MALASQPGGTVSPIKEFRITRSEGRTSPASAVGSHPSGGSRALGVPRGPFPSCEGTVCHPFPAPGDLIVLRKLGALDLLHGEIEAPIREPAELVYGEDVGVLKLCFDLRLVQKPGERRRMMQDLVMRDLDRT